MRELIYLFNIFQYLVKSPSFKATYANGDHFLWSRNYNLLRLGGSDKRHLSLRTLRHLHSPFIARLCLYILSTV